MGDENNTVLGEVMGEENSMVVEEAVGEKNVVLEKNENWHKAVDIDIIYDLFTKSVSGEDIGEVVIIGKKMKRGGEAILNLKGEKRGKKARKRLDNRSLVERFARSSICQFESGGAGEKILL